MSQQPISLCVLVRKDESTLARCLRSARPLVEDMVVADMGGPKDTARVARQHGARVVIAPEPDDEAAALNLALVELKSPWVLWLAANEELPTSSHEVARRNAIPWTEDGQLLYYVGRTLFFPPGEKATAQAYSLYPKVTLFPRHPGFRFMQPVYSYLSFQGVSGRADYMRVHDLVVYHYMQRDASMDIERLERLVEAEPDNVAPRLQLCRALFSRGRYVDTMMHVYRILEQVPPGVGNVNPLTLALVCYFGAYSALQLGDPGEAADLAATGLWKQFTLYPLWQVLAMSYRALRGKPQAQAHIEEILSVDVPRRWLAGEQPALEPRYWGAFLFLGLLDCLEGDYDTAERLFEQASIIAPAMAAPFIARIEAALFADRPEVAAQVVRDHGARFPQFRELLAALGPRLDQLARVPAKAKVDRQPLLKPAVELVGRMKEDWTS